MARDDLADEDCLLADDDDDDRRRRRLLSEWLWSCSSSFCLYKEEVVSTTDT